MAEADFTHVAAQAAAEGTREDNPLNFTYGFFDHDNSDLEPEERAELSSQYRAWNGVKAISRMLLANTVEEYAQGKRAQALDHQIVGGLFDALLAISGDRLEALEARATEMELRKFRR